MQPEEANDETIATEDTTNADCTGESLSSELTEKIDAEQPESDEPPIENESESVLEDNSHCLDQLEVLHSEEIEHYSPVNGHDASGVLHSEEIERYIPVNGHDASGEEPVTYPKSYEGAKDLPLPYDASYDEDDKPTSTEVVPEVASVPVLEAATKAIAEKLPPAITSFTRDQIISKNCSLSYSK